MKAPLFEDILTICQAIADASSKSDEQAREAQYQLLIKLCAANENSPKDHPLQWEALADFTNDAEQALDIYQKGLACAEKLDFVDYKASIYLAIAQRNEEIENTDLAREYAEKANELVEELTNDELKTDVKEYLKTVS